MITRFAYFKYYKFKKSHFINTPVLYPLPYNSYSQIACKDGTHAGEGETTFSICKRIYRAHASKIVQPLDHRDLRCCRTD